MPFEMNTIVTELSKILSPSFDPIVASASELISSPSFSPLFMQDPVGAEAEVGSRSISSE